MRLLIRDRLLLVMVSIALFSAGAAALISNRMANEALRVQTHERLTAVREMKAEQIEKYFELIEAQVVTLSEDRMVSSALRELRAGFDAAPVRPDASALLARHYDEEFVGRLATSGMSVAVSDALPRSNQGRSLQLDYIVDNQHKIGAKHLLDASPRQTAYDAAHSQVHPVLRSYLERFGYYDLFLIDPSGRVVYSVFKEVDFATSLEGGPHRESNLAAAFRAARDAQAHDFVKLVDFAPYLASYGAHASFIASPVYDGGEFLGVLAFQMPIEGINDTMTSGGRWQDVGLGQSGETYLVGPDFRLRSQSRFMVEDREAYLRSLSQTGLTSSEIARVTATGSVIGVQESRTAGVTAALAGETGVDVFNDYRGVSVVSAYRPIAVRDVNWVLMSEIDEAEAWESATQLRNTMALLTFLLVVLMVGAAMVVARDLSRPIRLLADRAVLLAGGDLETALTLERDDELGELAEAFERMRKSLKELVARQESAIDALSTPLIPLTDDVVVMPLVGALDGTRVARIRRTLVEGLHERRARVAILDLTGVPSIEDGVGEALLKTATAARLVGAHVVLTGVGPELAEMLLQVRVDSVSLHAEGSLAAGIDYAMHYLDGRK